METCGICAYVTHEFAVFPKAKSRGKIRQTSGLPRRIYHMFPWCNWLILYYPCVMKTVGICGHVTNQIHRMWPSHQSFKITSCCGRIYGRGYPVTPMASWCMASIGIRGSSSRECSASDCPMYDSSTFEGSDGSSSDDGIVPFMYEPITNSIPGIEDIIIVMISFQMTLDFWVWIGKDLQLVAIG